VFGAFVGQAFGWVFLMYVSSTAGESAVGRFAGSDRLLTDVFPIDEILKAQGAAKPAVSGE
jgi:hypothetical protein